MFTQRKLFGFVQYPADGDGNDLGGAPVDRGDDLLPPDPEVPADNPPADKEPELDLDKEPDPAKDAKPEEGADGEDEGKGKKGKSANERIQDLINKGKAREAEYQAKIKELEDSQARMKVAEDLTEVENKLAEMEEKYAQLLLDGDAKQATALRAEIRKMEKAVYMQQAKMESMQAKDAAKEEIRYDSTVATLEEAYPQINPDSEEYDPEQVDEILAIHKGLVSQGLPPSLSIQRAVKYVLGAPSVANATTERGLQRAKDTKLKNAEAAKKQPADLGVAGTDSDKMGGGIDNSSVLKMSYEDFSKLSDDALAKMRGDYV